MTPDQHAQLALLLEVASTPKPGNVDRHHDHPDLLFEHFLAGAIGAGGGLRAAQAGSPIGPAFEIAGVMPDVHINSMREAIAPTVFAVSAQPSSGYNVLVRFAPGRTAEGLRHVRTVLADVRPDTPPEVSFLSEAVADLYDEERRFGILTTTLAALAILLAALGLAGLVGYLTRLRVKEIGVRKALGGSVGGIVALLNREYVVIVGVAFAVGVPLAWLAANWWLQRFAYRIELSPLVFIGAGVGALAVAVAAVSVQAVRAARVSPAEALRSE